MATQTITRLTSIPEHTLDEALQNPKGEPSTSAKGKDTNPTIQRKPDSKPDPGDNHGDNIHLQKRIFGLYGLPGLFSL